LFYVSEIKTTEAEADQPTPAHTL